MDCPQCKLRIFGLDCERCGHELPPRCPACQKPFTRVDRYCHACGLDLFFHNTSNKIHLRYPINVLPEAYEYPSDRTGLKLLHKAGPLRELSRLLILQVTEPMLHGQLLGTAVKVTENQFPRIRRIASVCERILNLPPVNIFVGQTPPRMVDAQAVTYGTEDSACIFLPALLVDAVSDNELRFILGREMGHIKCRHVLYLTAAQLIGLGFSIFEGVTGQIITAVLGQILSPWQRRTEITADRAGLVCCQNIATAVRTMVKVAMGAPKLFNQVNLEEYLKQADTLRENFAWSEPREAHPYLIHRVHLLMEFHHSSQYRQIFQGAYDPECPKILCSRCRAYEYLTDHDRPLAAISCSSCRAALGVIGIYCPHCHKFVKLADAQMTLARFKCPECQKPYFVARDGPRSAGLESHYDVLGVHESASEQDIERAFLAVVKPTLKSEVERTGVRPTPADIQRRLKAQTAYRTLSHRKSREDYDLHLAVLRELERSANELELTVPPNKLPCCACCDSPLYGTHCSRCGSRPEELPSSGEPPTPPPADAASDRSAEEPTT
ncbi:MAG: M48 family metalloprotease [Candidatus Riflebacteria bacterium]|nr:M48 family metalloprotease [Candidatus Riflebacteria bacterium]